VSLEVVELIIKVLKYFEIIILTAVKSELEEMATYNDICGAAAKRILIFVERGKIVVKKSKWL